jgi:hypothetical protein
MERWDTLRRPTITRTGAWTSAKSARKQKSRPQEFLSIPLQLITLLFSSIGCKMVKSQKKMKPHKRPNHPGGNSTPVEVILSRYDTPLASALKKIGWRLKDVASHCDSSADTMTLYVSGKRLPPLATAHKIRSFIIERLGGEYTIEGLFPRKS